MLNLSYCRHNKSILSLAITVIFLFLNQSIFSQSCAGSLGDAIVNQDFGTGNNPGAALGSTATNYTHTTGCPSDGSYAIRSSIISCNAGWHNVPQDHTPGDVNGYMMLINASYTAGQFYNQTVTGLCGNSTYEFSSWIMNILLNTACTTNANRFPNITFRIETTAGALIQSFTTGNVAGATTPTWIRQATFFTTPAGVSTVVLKLINNAPGGCGNDLVLDDIQFRPCGPTVSANVGPSSTICLGNSVNLTGTISAGYNLPVYQWQQSTDNATFTDIVGATALTYTATPPASGTRYFRMLSSESGNLANTKCRVASNVLTVTVNPIPAAPTATSTVNLCQSGTSSSLSASGIGLKWYTTPTGGTSSASPPTPTTGTVGTTPYYVSQTVSGCESPRTRIDATVNPVLNLTLTSGSVACTGAITSGTLIANVSGGTPTFSYTLNGGASQTTNVYNNLATGSYTVVATDSKGCTATGTFSVAVANPLSINTSATTNCVASVNNGVIAIEGGGGTPAYLLQIDNVTQSGASPFTGITPGNHTASVVDANGCKVTANVTVPTISPLGVSLASSTACTFNGQGSVSVTGTGGSSPYQYQLGSGAFQASNTFTGLSAGSFVVTIKDNRNCTSIVNATLALKPDAPTSTALVEYCQNATASALGVTLTSGATANWYTTATGGSATASVTPSTTSAGSTTYYVSQTLGACESERTMVVVNVHPNPVLSSTTTNACFGTTNGTINVSATSGSAPFNFSLNGGAGQVASLFTGLSANNYNLAVTDVKNCITTNTATVAQSSSALSVNLTSSGGTCIDPGQGSIAATGVGGGGTNQFKFDEGDFGATSNFTAVNAGTHTITIKDQFGCLAQNTITFNAIPTSVASSNSPTCLVSGANVLELVGADPGTGHTFSWTGSNSFTSTDLAPTLVYSTSAQNGVYTFVVSKDGCSATSTINVACNNSLPIKLSYFEAIQDENNVVVSWITAQEIDSDKFQVLKSTDARNFEAIGTIKAAGNSKDNRYYHFTDTAPFEGISYYRLKSIDTDGTSELSKIASVRFEKDQPTITVVNPAEDNTLIVRTNIPNPKFEFYDVLGRAFGFDIAPQGNNIYHLKIKSSGIRLGILRTSSEFKNYTNKVMFK
jgi:large repetitive protein